MIDIAKARALCEAPLTRAIRIQKCILLPEALDALEEEQDSKKRGWALAMEHADTVNALKAENARLRKALEDVQKLAEHVQERRHFQQVSRIYSVVSTALAAPQTGGDDV